MEKKVKLFFSAISLFITALVMSFATYAWFASDYTGPEKPAFTVGIIEDPFEFTTWTYTTTKEGTAGWEMFKSEAQGEFYFEMPTATKNGATYLIKSLHLGTVDNLVRIKDDNIMYARFSVSTAENGKKILLWINQPESGYLHAFDKNGADVSLDENVYAQKNGAARVAETEAINLENPFIKYKYFISQNKYSLCAEDGATVVAASSGKNVTREEFDAMFLDLPKDSSKASMANKSNQFYVSTDIGAVLANQSYEGEYYIYLKLETNLKAFGKAATKLYPYMPATMFFDWQWELEVH